MAIYIRTVKHSCKDCRRHPQIKLKARTLLFAVYMVKRLARTIKGAARPGLNSFGACMHMH